jgi:hypothetical protein
MGGGGGDYERKVDREEEMIAEKEAQAKAELERAKAVRRNLFISFASEDIDTINLLRGQAKNERSDIDFVDRSVRDPFDSKRSDYIRQRISERIRQSSMTAVFLSPDAAGSSWVNWEIERSIELGRKVVAFFSGDRPPNVLPEAVRRHGIKIVPWSALADEIEPEESD